MISNCDLGSGNRYQVTHASKCSNNLKSHVLALYFRFSTQKSVAALYISSGAIDDGLPVFWQHLFLFPGHI